MENLGTRLAWRSRKFSNFVRMALQAPKNSKFVRISQSGLKKKNPYFTYFTNSSTVLILEKITLHPSRQHRPTLIFLAIDLTTFNTGYFSNTNRFFLIPFLVKIFRNENELWNTPSHKYLSEKDIKICTK